MSRNRDTGSEGTRRKPPDEAFARRWSRMKRGAQPVAAEAEAAETPPPADERSDAEILRELDLPDPETLKPGDDIKGFMTSAVPARIRNRVLRRLWLSNPALANLDGLVDYGEDFTDAAMVPAMLGTAYKVGRGWMQDPAEEEAAKTAANPADAPAGDVRQPVRNATPEVTGAPTDESCETPGEVVPEVADGPAGDTGATARQSVGGMGDPEPRLAVRRMRFRFAGE